MQYLAAGQKYGSLIKIKVDNMREQHSAIVNEASQAPTAKPAKKVKVSICNCNNCYG